MKLDEDGLLQVVQLVHQHKTDDTYLKNDVESKFIPSSPFICLSPCFLACVSRGNCPVICMLFVLFISFTRTITGG